MPDMPPTFRGNRAPRDEQNREHDKRRRRDIAHRSWYDRARWRDPKRGIRAQQLRRQPLCERCDALGIIEPATVVNHKGGHGGDEAKFWNGPFESVCKPCHDSTIQREEAAARKEAK